MEKLIAAFATDDGESFIDRHFGDAEFYDIYEISEDEVKLIKRIDNSTEDDNDEEGHGDPVKAQGVTGMLKKEGVNMAVSRVFGPNLKRIKKKFLCILVGKTSIEESLKILQKRFPSLLDEWNVGEERTFIRL
ncbi:MAG: dinitrogenase iron-molybdenum cofactor biosynthesis protein [Spirochaetes bacterium]|nr:MAG: dinitrogenase iron-molybdenum cofactor biosynthesis protein [Spirochaetota bacterium]